MFIIIVIVIFIITVCGEGNSELHFLHHCRLLLHVQLLIGACYFARDVTTLCKFIFVVFCV